MSPLFHLTTPAHWERARVGDAFAPESLARDGFVHLSFSHQVEETARRHFPDVAPLWAIALDPARLPDLRIEDLYGHGDFPHAYGPIPADAVLDVRILRPAPETPVAPEEA